MPSGEIRRGPCCFDLCLEVTKTEYQRFFLDQPNISTIGFFDASADHPTLRIIRITGQCPHHDNTTGRCLIHSSRPANCRTAQALKFELCAKAPSGRWSQYLLQ